MNDFESYSYLQGHSIRNYATKLTIYGDRNMKKSFLFSLITALVFSFASISSFAADKKPLKGEKLVVTIKSADVFEAGMGLSLATSAAKKGAKVTVVIGAGASAYPMKKGGQPIFAAKKKTPREMLTELVNKGATVYLCSTCAEFHKLEEKDLIDGVQIVKSIKIWDRLFEEGARSMTY